MPAEVRQYNTATFETQLLVNGNPKDISLATSKKIHFIDPDDNLETEDAAFTSDGTDGKIEADYTPDQLGGWRYQAEVILGGKLYHGNFHYFQCTPIADPAAHA